jgi:hypothetical protein
MKKGIQFLICLCCCMAYSQPKFGVFTGVNYSYFTDGFAGQIGGENATGLQLGALVEFELTPKISFRPKLIYSQQGDRSKTADNREFSTELTDLDYQLDYLNIPLDFKFGKKFYLITGPQLGFLLQQKCTGVNVGYVPTEIELGLNVGTGFTIHRLFFEFGVFQGMSTLLNYTYEPTGALVDVRNGLAKFTLGYQL